MATAGALGPRTKQVVDRTWEVCGCEEERDRRVCEQQRLEWERERQAEMERREKKLEEAHQQRLREIRDSEDRADLAALASDDDEDHDFRAAALLRLTELANKT